MKIRIEGTVPELDAAVDRLRREFFIQSVSEPYKNRAGELYRVYVDAELPADEYKTIIRLKDDVSGDLLATLASTIEKAFVNRAGTLQNVSDKPREFVFQGGESCYGCLELGMLDLREITGFLNYVEAWDWIDIDPDECCDMLEVYARHPVGRIVANCVANQALEGLVCDEEDKAAVRRIVRGETTAEEEVAKVLAKYRE